MTISVVIVNYNVKYFLGQCIASLYQSACADDLEIIVVDNASQDGSEAHIAQHFPDVRWIGLDANVGFSKANNIGVDAARGDHVLILNPDTIVSAQAIVRCRDYLVAHPDTGILGAKMRDGSGQYLPESKRGLPTAMSAFYKFSGLASIFPSSATFNQYYMGHRSADETSEVDVLTGAFMYMERATYGEVGGFDEDYFMYGEDIDLSYVVQRTGRKNVYLPTAEIIHFKGESTRKSSVDYVKRFYDAMLIFARKHGQGRRAYMLGLRLAILTKGGLALTQQVIKKLWPVVFDGVLLLATFITVTELWEWGVKGVDFYKWDIVWQNSLIYLAIILIVLVLGGKYHRRLSAYQYLRYAGMAVILLLAIYSLLPSSVRYSRAVLMMGSILGLSLIGGLSYAWRRLESSGVSIRRVAVVGDSDEMAQLLDLLERRQAVEVVGVILPREDSQDDERILGDLSDVEDIVRFHQLDELIFDQRYVSLRDIMETMTRIDGACEGRLYADEVNSIVSSYSSTYRGEVASPEVTYKISTPYGRFIKRTVDVTVCVGLMVSLSLFWARRSMDDPLAQWWSVLVGRSTWIGYLDSIAHSEVLPQIKPAVWPHFSTDEPLGMEQKMNINFIYAREYTSSMDINSIVRHLMN